MALPHCKNCQAQVTGDFCSACGQDAHTHTISFGYLVHECVHAVTHADKGFVLLMKSLLTRPGFVAKEYIDGKRKKYFNPLSFFVLTSAIHAYIVGASGYFTRDNSGRTASGRPMPTWMVDAFNFSNGNERVLQFLLIAPLLAVLTYLLFRKSGRNLAELLVLFAFVIGESNVIRICIFVPAFLAFPAYSNLNIAVFELALIAYMVVALRQFFGQNIILTIVKAVLIVLLMIVFYWMIVIGLAALIKLLL